MLLTACGGNAEPEMNSHGYPTGAPSGGTTEVEATQGSTTEWQSEGTGGETSTDSTSTSSTDSDGDTTGGEETGASETTSAPEQSCNVVSVEGTCSAVTDCADPSTAFGGDLCGGPPSRQCCVPAGPSCSVDGAPGICMDTADCSGSFVSTAGLCPGDANIQCCTDPRTACDPDVRPAPNEGLEEQPWDDACPAGMVSVAGFCIDRFEASLVELDGSGDPIGSWSPFHNPGSARVRAVSLRGAIPQGYISADQAADACAEAGKRLCDDEEWMRACQGANTTTYPYGDTIQPGVCNDARDDHPVIEFYGTTADWIWSATDNACISQIPDSLDTTGENEDCISDDGVFDMMGNLHEWTSNPGGVFRGGFYVDTANNGPGCLYDTEAHSPQYWDYSTGFRCCAD